MSSILDRQHGGDQCLRVGVLRVVKHLVGQARFDPAPALHHHEAVREQARLGGDVQAGRGLVHEHEARGREEIARDGEAQLLADLRDARFGHACIAATRFVEQTPRCFDRAFSSFDGDIHQFISTLVVRGRPTSWSPQTR